MEFPYFKLKDAIDDLRSDFSYGDAVDKATSVAKLIGKTAANVGMLSAELGVEIVKSLPEHLAKQADHTLKTNPNLSDEQRSKLETIVNKGKAQED